MGKLLDLIRDQRRRGTGREIFFRRGEGPQEALGLMQQPGETFDAFRKRVDAVAEAQGVQICWIVRVFVYSVYDGNSLIGRIEETLDGEIRAFDRDNTRIGSFSSLEAVSAAYRGRAQSENRGPLRFEGGADAT